MRWHLGGTLQPRIEAIKDAEEPLDGKALAKYPTLRKDEVKMLMVDDKWLAGIAATIHGEMDRISQTRKITHHLEEMGFTL